MTNPFNYSSLSLDQLIEKISISRFFNLPKMVAEALRKIQATPSYEPPYKVYTALLTQSGTNAPVATVLENTFGVTVTFNRQGTGYYRLILSDEMLTMTNFSFIQGAGNEATLTSFWGYFQNTTTLNLETYDLGNMDTTIEKADDLLVNQLIELKIYS